MLRIGERKRPSGERFSPALGTRRCEDVRLAEEQVRSLSQQAEGCHGAAWHRGGTDGATVFGKLLPGSLSKQRKSQRGREKLRDPWLAKVLNLFCSGVELEQNGL